MNADLIDYLKGQAPKMQRVPDEHYRRNLDPSKAWIKNVGAGTTKEMPRFKGKRENVLVSANEKSKTPTASNASKRSTTVSAQTTNDKSVAESQTNISGVEKINSTEKSTDISLRSLSIDNNTFDTDNTVNTNYHTCIDLDATLLEPIETLDVKPTNAASVQSEVMGIKSKQRVRNLSELNSALDEYRHDDTSVYGGMGTIDWMNSRMTHPEMLSQELPTLKHEENELFDDTLICERLPTGLDITVIPSRAYELSIPLGAFDFPSPSSLSIYDTKPNVTAQSPRFNSTTLPENTIAEIDLATNVLREINWIEPEKKTNANVLDPHTPFKVPSYEEFKSDKKHKSSNKSELSNMSWSMLAKASSQVPKTPSLSKQAFMHPVYMRDEDVNRLIESGHIFFIDGRLHYKHKPTVSKKIF